MVAQPKATCMKVISKPDTPVELVQPEPVSPTELRKASR